MEELYEILKKSWSKDTCFPSGRNTWSSDNPSYGQCAITSIVVQDLCGGKIMKCMCDEVSHYYNEIDGKIIDYTKDQFKNIPNYELGEERTKKYLLSNEDTKKRYMILLKKVYNNLIDYSFDKINSDKRINKESLHEIARFSTFEIDYYEETEEYEEVQFDLSAQNTGNIFNYRHIKDTDEYILMDKLLFSLKGKEYEIPKNVLKEIFIVAKENKEEIKNIKALLKKFG